MRLFHLRTPPMAFGLDLSNTTAKIAQLRRAGKNFVIEALTEIPISPNLIKDGEIQNAEQFNSELNKFLQVYRKDLVEGVIISLPEAKTFIQTIVIPKHNTAALAQQLDDALPEYLPLPLNEMYQDSAVLAETDKEWRVVTGAAPKNIVDNYIQLLESSHLIPVALDIQAMAIARALIPDKETRRRTRAIIDLGRHRASLIIHDQKAVQFTMSLPIAGERITENIAQELNLTLEQAEKAKITCGLDPMRCEGVLRNILEQMVEDLVKRVAEAREYYQDHFIDAHDFEEVLLTGGGAYLLCLDQVLSEVLKIPVKLGNPWENIRLSSAPQLTAPLRFTNVLGLALRGAEGEMVV